MDVRNDIGQCYHSHRSLTVLLAAYAKEPASSSSPSLLYLLIIRGWVSGDWVFWREKNAKRDVYEEAETRMPGYEGIRNQHTCKYHTYHYSWQLTMAFSQFQLISVLYAPTHTQVMRIAPSGATELCIMLVK